MTKSTICEENKVAVAWYTAAEGQPKVKVAFSLDNGHSFYDSVEVDHQKSIGRIDLELLADGTALVCWMDTVNDSQYVPTWKNTIIAKVTRINMDDDDDDDDDPDFAGRGVSATTPTHPAPPAASHVPRAPPQQISSSGSSDHLDIFGDGPSTTSSTTTHSTAPPPPSHQHHHQPPAPPSGTTANLLDGHHTAPHPAAPSSAGSDLLGMDGFGGPTQPAPATSAHSDFLGMTAPAPTTTPAATATPSRPVQQQGYPGATPHHNPYGQTPSHAQQAQRPPQQQL